MWTAMGQSRFFMLWRVPGEGGDTLESQAAPGKLEVRKDMIYTMLQEILILKQVSVII
jgi:hypothetical protein